MNKNKTYERKITLETSDQSQSVPQHDAKSPANRFTSLKTISFKEVPFSQHIFCEKPVRELKVMSATSFNPQGWSFEPRWDILQKQLEEKSSGQEVKNKFLEAKLAYINKKKQGKTLVKRKSVMEEGSQDFVDDVVTFRTIRKNSKEDEEEACTEPVM